MDATYGDSIRFEVNSLYQVEVIASLGKSYNGIGSRNYKWNDYINDHNGGFIQYPYPYKGYVIITFPEHVIKSRRYTGLGSYSLNIKFIKNKN